MDLTQGIQEKSGLSSFSAHPKEFNQFSRQAQSHWPTSISSLISVKQNQTGTNGHQE
jgi:hypothetical protein